MRATKKQITNDSWREARFETPSKVDISERPNVSVLLSLQPMVERKDGAIDGAVCLRSLSLQRHLSRGLYFRVIDITMLEKHRAKGTRAENTNYNDTRPPPPRKQTRCPRINLSGRTTSGRCWTGREPRLGCFLPGNWSLFSNGPKLSDVETLLFDGKKVSWSLTLR